MLKKLAYILEAFITAVLFVAVVLIASWLIAVLLATVGLKSNLGNLNFTNIFLTTIVFMLAGLMLWDKKGLFLILPLAMAIGAFSLFYGSWPVIIPALFASYAGWLLGQKLKWGFISFRRGTPSNTPPDLGSQILVVLFIGFVAWTVIIPKVPGDGLLPHNSAIAKEAAAMINGAFSAYMDKNKLSKHTKPSNFLPFMNYVAIDTTDSYRNENTPLMPNWLNKLWGKVTMSDQQDTPLQPCSNRLPCVKLHNGGILQYDSEQIFGGMNSTNAIFFNFDPDGKGPQGRVSFYQYANGRLTTGENQVSGTIVSAGTMTSQNKDPAYLKAWLK